MYRLNNKNGTRPPSDRIPFLYAVEYDAMPFFRNGILSCVKRADAAVTLPIRSLLPNRAVHSVSGNRIGKAGFC